MRLTRRALFAGIAAIFSAKALPVKRPPRYGDREIARRLAAALERMRLSLTRLNDIPPLTMTIRSDFSTKDLIPQFKKLEARIESSSIRNQRKP